MTRFLRLALPLSIITCLLLALGYWNIRPETFFDDRQATGSLEPEIDFFADNAISVQYQADGSVQYDLHAPRLEHLRESDVSLLTRPDLKLYNSDGLPWQVSSERAQVSSNGERVDLIGQVRIHRDDRLRPTTLSSSYMTLYPEREYAETHVPVHIESGNSVTTARGLQAYLKEGRMLLKSTVRGQHEIR